MSLGEDSQAANDAEHYINDHSQPTEYLAKKGEIISENTL